MRVQMEPALRCVLRAACAAASGASTCAQTALSSSEVCRATRAASTLAAWAAPAPPGRPQQPRDWQSWGGLGIAAAAALTAASASAALAEAPSFSPSSSGTSSGASGGVLSVDTKRRLFFKYEKRMREMSSVDKVFEYFASVRIDGVSYMEPEDLLRAVVATYPPEGSAALRGGSLPGEPAATIATRPTTTAGTLHSPAPASPPAAKQPPPKAAAAAAKPSQALHESSLFKKFDVNRDGFFSFPEFLALLALLSIPAPDVMALFAAVDADGSGAIDADEFALMLQQLQRMAQIEATGRWGRTFQRADFASTDLQTFFFGADGCGQLRQPDLAAMLSALQAELSSLEFNHYDHRGTDAIRGQDLARSVVCAEGVRTVDQLLDRVR